ERGNQRGEIVANSFVRASTATSESSENCRISFEQVFTSEHASKPTETGNQNNVHRCPVCGKTFQYTGILKRHRKSHTNYQDYQCRICPNAYKHLPHLREHMRAKHPGEFIGPYRASSKQVQQSHE
ncbi:hypothetical protein CRM22_010699, partial [Opisthorchis felineus]